MKKTKEEVETQGLMITENKEELNERIDQLMNENANKSKGGGGGGPELVKLSKLAKSLDERVIDLEADYKVHKQQTDDNTDDLKAMKETQIKRSARKDNSQKSRVDL